MSLIFSVLLWTLAIITVYLIGSTGVLIYLLVTKRLSNGSQYDDSVKFERSIDEALDEAFMWPGYITMYIGLVTLGVCEVIKNAFPKTSIRSFLYYRLQRSKWYSDFDDIIQDEM